MAKDLEWAELYDYVKYEIFGYEKNMSLSKYCVLRLKGLKNGKFMANNNSKGDGNYTFKEILIVFKLMKGKLKSYLSNDLNFKDEKHKINGVMFIVENELNEVVLKLRKAEKQTEKIETIDIVESDSEYVRRENNTNVSNKLKNLW